MTSTPAWRHTVRQLLGQFPARPPLAIEHGESEATEHYTRTPISYMVESGERVPAWLLQPNGPPPAGGWPALLAVHQHAGAYELGKSEPAGLSTDPMYHYGHDLCVRGYAVLCPDQLCFEERRPSEAQRHANAAMDGQNYERFVFTQRLLHGTCLQTKYLHDLVCALDVLEALPQINRQRMGVIGHSLGGQEALWLAWYDRRVQAAVSSCGFGLISTILRDGINHNLALYVPGLLASGDLDALVADLAPTPFMLTAGVDDSIFPIDGVRTIVERATTAYAAAGVPERFRAQVFPGGHSFPNEIKDQAYRFLDTWLK